MTKERLHFLKRELFFNIFILVISFLSLFSFFNTFESTTISLKIYLGVFIVYLIIQIVGFWRLDFGYLGKALMVLAMGICLITSFVLGVMLKPLTPDEIGTYIGITSPFNYVILTLYFGTIFWILFKIFQEAQRNNETLEARISQRDIDFQKGLIYLAFTQNAQNKDTKINPKKHSIAIWLTVITQALLIKMSWNSTASGILAMVAFSLIGIVCLVAALGLFFGFLDIRSIEKGRNIKLKPALRQPFKLRQTLKEGQKNSY